MSRSPLSAVASAAAAVAAAVLLPASVASADPTVSQFYFGETPEDNTPANPVLFLSPGQNAVFHLFAQLSPVDDFNSLGAGIITTNPSVATPTNTTFVNPLIDLPGTDATRWSAVSTSPGGGFAVATAGGSPGLDGLLQIADPTYRPDFNSSYIGSYTLVVNAVSGQIKPIFLSTAYGGTIPSGMVYQGIGDPPVPAAGGVSTLPDAYIVVPGPGISALPGDYNGNGTVDAADYVVWRKNLGQSSTLPNDITPGDVGQSDYDTWRSNFGRTSGGSPSAPGLSGAAGPVALATPLVQVVDQGLTPGGKHSYLVRIASSEPLDTLAVELAIDGPIVDVRARAARVNDRSDANAFDGTLGYEREEDTWYDDAVWQSINRGLNPFTGTVTTGFAADYADGELFLALGSGANNGAAVDLLQIVLEPGQLATFAGTIFQDGQSSAVAGLVQVPEPVSAAATTAALLLLSAARPRRRRP